MIHPHAKHTLCWIFQQGYTGFTLLYVWGTGKDPRPQPPFDIWTLKSLFSHPWSRSESYLREPPWPACSHELSTGGGSGVEMVEVEMSPMILSASFRAWCVRSTSSLRWTCSWDSSISAFWSPAEYSWARSSALMKSFTLGRGILDHILVQVHLQFPRIYSLWSTAPKHQMLQSKRFTVFLRMSAAHERVSLYMYNGPKND